MVTALSNSSLATAGCYFKRQPNIIFIFLQTLPNDGEIVYDEESHFIEMGEINANQARLAKEKT